ncbi:MAG: GlxA family transcriptional regulator [Cypionkella sp.]
MTRKIPCRVPSTVRVELLIALGFIATELAVAMDALRIANRLAGRQLYSWDIVCTQANGRVAALGGLEIAARVLAPDDRLPDVLVMVGGSGAATMLRAVLPRVQRLRLAGGLIVALSDASQSLLRIGGAQTAVVHWENDPVIEEAGLASRSLGGLFARQGNLFTSAGMVSTLDVLLAVIAETADRQIAREVGRVMLIDKARNGSTDQPRRPSAATSLYSAATKQALRLMEDSLESPLRTAAIAAKIGISSRQLERLFLQHFGSSPQMHFRRMRLAKARILIEGTDMSLSEISLACGFGTHSSFSNRFKDVYGVTPHQLRRYN